MKSLSIGAGEESAAKLLAEHGSYLLNMQKIMDFLPMAAYAVRAPDGVIVWYNAMACKLWGREPVVGDTEERFCGAHKLHYPDGRPMAHCDTPVALALETGASTHEEAVVIERPDGSKVEVSVHIDAVRDQAGSVIGAVNFFRDSTERRQAEQSAVVQRQAQQLRELSNRLQQTQDEERRRISRELHDSAGQIVTALKLNLASMKNSPVNEAAMEETLQFQKEMLDELCKELRTMSYLLHPPLLEETGLAGAVRMYVNGLAARGGLEIELNISENFERLPEDLELALFRIIQECLTNVYRHSGSRVASIELARTAECVKLEVADQGSGIPPEQLAQIRTQRSGVGMTGMWERVRQLGGQMDIQSSGAGTTISVTMPIPKPECLDDHRTDDRRNSIGLAKIGSNGNSYGTAGGHAATP